MQLEDYADRMPAQLSGGQRQRVALMRALAPDPQVLLLDEPLSALDAKLRQQMQIELKSIQERTGKTFLFVTHDQEEALTMSDVIVVMNEGRIEQIGDPKTLYHRPGQPLRRQLHRRHQPASLHRRLAEGDAAHCSTGAARRSAPTAASAGGRPATVTVAVRPEALRSRPIEARRPPIAGPDPPPHLQGQPHLARDRPRRAAALSPRWSDPGAARRPRGRRGLGRLDGRAARS